MRLYPFPDTKPWKAFVFAALTALLVFNRDALYGMVFGGSYFNLVAGPVILVILGLAFLWVSRHRLKEVVLDPRMLLALVCVAAFLVPMTAKRDWQLMYFSILCCLLGGILISYFLTLEQVCRYYVIALSVLAAWSVLCTYVLRLLPDGGLVPVPMVRNTLGYRFYVMAASFVSLDHVPYRNFGIFREPGIYQYFLVLGLYLTNYQVTWDKTWKLWTANAILALTLVTTFATGGLIELVLLAGVILLDKQYYKIKWVRMLIFAGIAAVAAVIAYSLITQSFLYRLLYEVFGKFFVKGNDSVTDRFGSIFVDLELFLHSPLLGVRLTQVFDAVPNNTSSSGIVIAAMGLAAGLIHLLGWIALVFQGKKHLFWQLCLLVILAMSFNTCNVSWNMNFWLIPTVALCQKGPALPLNLRKGGN